MYKMNTAYKPQPARPKPRAARIPGRLVHGPGLGPGLLWYIFNIFLAYYVSILASSNDRVLKLLEIDD